MSGGKKAREVRDALLVNLSACKYSLVREAAERSGYEVVEDETELWDLFWSDLSVASDRVQRLLPFQRLNHFPGMLEICRKAALSRHMARMAARLPDQYRFYPPSLVLPDQLDELMAALRRNKARADAASAAAGGGGAGSAGAGRGGAGAGGDGVATYILKPSAGTQGRGIALVQYPHQLVEAGDVGSCVAQAYVSSPLLLDGFKFDLRVYALIASVDPLRIHLYDEGLARLATEPYKPPCPANLRATTMHLTNYAVNRAAAGFVSADSAPAGGGSKRPMSVVLAQLAAQHGTTQAALLGAIADVVTKTVMAIQPLLAHTYHTSLSTSATATCAPPCSCPSLDHACSAACGDPTLPCGCPPSLCFELLGFDILFDTQLQPWLLEVNHSPSFAGDSRLDRAVKGDMLTWVLKMLGQRPEAKRAFLEAEARAQSERLYSSSAGAANSGGSGAASGAANGSSYTPVGAVIRRAQSALPRSRQLQAAAAALEEISANSAALLAAGGHVWGGGAGGSATPGGAGGRNGYPRPASSSAAGASSPRGRQYGGGGGAAGGAGGAKRSLSFSSTSGGGASGGGGLGICGGFKLVFPTSCDDDRKRYYRILQTAADLYPQQRCQCPWCTRRREVSLLAMSGQQLGLAARPPSAALTLSSLSGGAGGSGGYSYGYHSHGLSGHLPARPGALSAQRRRNGLASSASRGGGAAAASVSSAAAVAVAGEDGGSDTERRAFTAAHGWEAGRDAHNHHHHLSAPGSLSSCSGSSAGGGGGAVLSRPGTSSQDAPRGKPPRPGSDVRSSSRSRSGSERQASGGGAPAPPAGSAPACSAGGRGNGPQPPTANNHPGPAFPAPPTMASVLAGSGGYGRYGHGYGGGSAGRTALQQRRGSAAVPPTLGGSGGSVRHLSSEESAESAGAQPAGCDSVGATSSSSSQLGRSAAAGSSLGLGYGLASNGAGQLEHSDDGSDHPPAVHQSNGSGHNGNNHHLPDMYGTAADADPATDAATSHQDPPPHPHVRSNQMLVALRPLSHSKSHPQTRLGSGHHHHHHHHHQQHQHQCHPQDYLPAGAGSGRWSGRPSAHQAAAGGGGAVSGGGGGSVRSSVSNSEVTSAGSSGGATAAARTRGDDPWLRSRTAQGQMRHQGGGGGGGGGDPGDPTAYGKKLKAPPRAGGNGGSAGGGVSNGLLATPYRPTATRRGVASADSPDASGDDDADGGGLRRSFSCGELGIYLHTKPSAPTLAAPGHVGVGPGATGHRPDAAAVARPWLAAAGGGGNGGGGGASATAPLLGHHGQGALAPTPSRTPQYGNTAAATASSSTGGGGGGGSANDPGLDAVGPPCVIPAAATAAAAAALVAAFSDAVGKSGAGGNGGGNGGGATAPRAPRFSASRRQGDSTSGAPMSAADLELLLVRAKTTNALSNKYITVYMQGGGGRGGPRSPR